MLEKLTVIIKKTSFSIRQTQDHILASLVTCREILGRFLNLRLISFFCQMGTKMTS